MSSRVEVDRALLSLRSVVIAKTLARHGIVLSREALVALTLNDDLSRYKPMALTDDQKEMPSLIARAAAKALASRSLAAAMGPCRVLLHHSRLPQGGRDGMRPTGRECVAIGVLLLIAVTLALAFWQKEQSPPLSGRQETREKPTAAVGPCTLARIINGDTVDIKCDGEKTRVRLLRIDTPVKGRFGYAEARAALARLIASQPVYVEYGSAGAPEHARFGRLLAYLYVDGVNVNVEMVRGGWSWIRDEDGEWRLADEFRGAQAEASDALRGLWAP